MGNTRLECFPQKSLKFWDPYFFHINLTQIISQKFQTHNESYLSIIVKWWSWCRGFWAIYQTFKCLDLYLPKKWKFWKKFGQTLKLIWDPLNFLLKIWNPLFFCPKIWDPFKNTPRGYSQLIMSTPLQESILKNECHYTNKTTYGKPMAKYHTHLHTSAALYKWQAILSPLDSWLHQQRDLYATKHM